MLYFDDTNGAGGTVPNTTLTTVAGGVSAGTLQFNNSAVNYTVNSSDAIGITGATAVVKSGTGTLTLAGANSYTGNTTISAGTLTIGSAGQLGGGNYAGNVSIASGGLVQLQQFRYAVPQRHHQRGRRADATGPRTP